MKSTPAVLILAWLVQALPAAAAAQQRSDRFEARPRPAQAVQEPPPSAFRPLRVAKWSALLAAAATAGYGFSAHTRADESYRELEEACAEDRERCLARLPDGAYADPALERLYQDVLNLDRRARIALVGSQIGVAATVVLFILDMRHGSGPPNIPYDPRSLLRVTPGRRGGLELGVSLPGRLPGA